MESPRLPLGTTGLAWVCGVAFLVHGIGIGGAYVLDDGPALLGHPAVTGEVPLHEVFTREWWGHPLAGGAWSSSYRPLTTLLFALEHRITKAPWLHHLINVLLFAMLSGVVAAMASRWMSRGRSLAVGLLFATLPIHVENVASIVGRADVLAALLCCAAFSMAMREPVRITSMTAVGALYGLALLSKESVALFPALLAWFIVVRLRAAPEYFDGASWLRALRPALVVGGVGILYLVARQTWLPVELPGSFNDADNLLRRLGGLERVWGNLAILGHYAELVVVPRRLCADHTYGDIVPPTSIWALESVWAWIGLAIAGVMLVDAVRAWRGRTPGLWFGCALAYLLLGHWWIDLSVILAERLALWPSVWCLLAIGASVEHWSHRSADGVPLRRQRVGVAVLVTLMGLRTVQRSFDWRNELVLYASSVRACPAAVHNRLNLARALSRAGKTDEAVWHFGVTAATRGYFPEPVPNLPAFEADFDVPLAERLQHLPRWVNIDEPEAFWRGLVYFLEAQGFSREAHVARAWWMQARAAGAP